MSNYRDDTQETMVASSFAFAKVVTGEVEFIKITDTIRSTIINSFEDCLSITDEVQSVRLNLIEDSLSIKDEVKTTVTLRNTINDSVKIADASYQRIKALESAESCSIEDSLSHKVIQAVTDTLTAGDVIQGVLNAKAFIHERFKVKDAVLNKKTDTSIIEDRLSATDSIQDKTRGLTTDLLIAIDLVTGAVKTQQNITDSLKATDTLVFKLTETISDSFTVSDLIHTATHFIDAISDTLNIQDQFIDRPHKIDLVTDFLNVLSESQGFKLAKGQISDTVFIEDDVLDNHQSDIAWTSSTDNWSMSRYVGFKYKQLAVINDNLYGVTEHGIELLEYGSQEIEAKMTTAMLDLGAGSLVHPLAMYLEYSLSGVNKSIDVMIGTTQTGDRNTYTYTLPAEKSDHLTNGRVQFGRGLRGRHFDFTVNITATAAYINDMNVEVAQTKRRI